MKTPLETMIDFLRDNHPETLPSTAEIERLLVSEKVHHQMWYNEGFKKAKDIYNGQLMDEDNL